MIPAARIVLAGVFLYACWHKIWDPNAFALTVFRYQLLPHASINVFALLLPWLELIVGLALLFSSRFRDAAAAWILFLMCLFTGAILLNIYRGIKTACGCFSVEGGADGSNGLHVAGNIVLIALAGYILWDSRRAAKR